LLILVPLDAMTYFLSDPAAFNAFAAWLARVLSHWVEVARSALIDSR